MFMIMFSRSKKLHDILSGQNRSKWDQDAHTTHNNIQK